MFFSKQALCAYEGMEGLSRSRENDQLRACELQSDHIKGGHRALSSYYIMGPSSVLMQDPCLSGLPETLIVPHVVILQSVNVIEGISQICPGCCRS